MPTYRNRKLEDRDLALVAYATWHTCANLFFRRKNFELLGRDLARLMVPRSTITPGLEL